MKEQLEYYLSWSNGSLVSGSNTIPLDYDFKEVEKDE